MFTSLSVRNFRVFGALRVVGLSRVNLIVGRNNVGKTSLLEALFLLSGGGNPQMALNSNVIRGAAENVTISGPPNTLRETYWKPMFFGLDTGTTIEIDGQHTEHGSLGLRILLEWPNVIELPLGTSGTIPVSNGAGEPPLVFSFTNGVKGGAEGRIRFDGSSIKVDQPRAAPPVDAVILSTRLVSHHEDVTRLGRLRTRKQGDLVVKALQIVEPGLRGVEDSFASGAPMIWGDIGLSELVPLAMMGEGMVRLARLVLAIVNTPGGLVLVDEIEMGLHHTVLADVWRAVGETARRFDAQVVATTHSYECAQAAHQAFGDNSEFCLHRLEAGEDGNCCVTYGPADIEAAVRHDLEIR